MSWHVEWEGGRVEVVDGLDTLPGRVWVGGYGQGSRREAWGEAMPDAVVSACRVREPAAGIRATDENILQQLSGLGTALNHPASAQQQNLLGASARLTPHWAPSREWFAP